MSGATAGATRHERKKQQCRMRSQRLSNGALYIVDKRLAPRIEQYLSQFRRGHVPDVEELVSHLQSRYREYNRKKRNAFKLLVQKVYQAISKKNAEERHLQDLEERFLDRKQNSFDNSLLVNSLEDKEKSDTLSELSDDSEFSLEGEPMMEVQNTNLMNQSMCQMYLTSGSRPTSEDEEREGPSQPQPFVEGRQNLQQEQTSAAGQAEKMSENNDMIQVAKSLTRTKESLTSTPASLSQFRRGPAPDVEELVSHLQSRYGEYNRKKRNAFKLSVQKVYQAISKKNAEERHLQDLEERSLDRKQNSFGKNTGLLVNNLEDKEKSDTLSELSDDSEFSLEEEPMMEVQNTNLMNQSMCQMYLTSGSRPTSEDEEREGPSQPQPFVEGRQNLQQEQTSAAGQAEKMSENNDMIQAAKSLTRTKESLTSTPAAKDDSVKRKREALDKSDRRQRESTPRRPRKKQKKSTAEVAPGQGDDSRDPEFAPVSSQVTFADVGGCEETVSQVCKLLVHMRHPEVFQTLGVTPPRGFLLHGPPGCGKTLLAHAIAGELGLPFIKIAATEIVSGVSGESEEKVRSLFSRAVAHSPCVLFIDEIDAITPKRETASKDMERRIVSQLLTCMDELNSNPEARILVIGATNRPDSLDPALRRAGRFDREISMGIPDEKARQRILRVLCQSLKLSAELSFAVLARATPGFVGADLMALTREAAMLAVNRIFQNLEQIAKQKAEENKVDDTRSVEVSALASTAEDEVQRPESNSCEQNDAAVKAKTTTPAEFSVLKWLKEQPPLTQQQLEKLHVETDDFKEALCLVQPSAKREGFATIPDVSWDDVGALKDVREELTMAILAPVQHPEEFSALGLTHPPGILLAGPPGCGKTLLAKAIANESGINFISVKGPELLNMYVGESERAVRQVFQRARNSSPCVIFFDELDSLCPRRSGSAESSASVRVVNQLLTEMDGLEARKQVYIMGATNRPDIIDPAVLRPGRLDKVLYVGLPNEDDRWDILKTLTKDGNKPLLFPDVNLKLLAQDERCTGFSGADLAALVREASMAALRERINQSPDSSDRLQVPTVGVGVRHFDAAFNKVKPSVSKKDQSMYEHMKAASSDV